MTDYQFKIAYKHLLELNAALLKRDEFARAALEFYAEEMYDRAMYFQLEFLIWQDTVNLLGRKTRDTKADRLWLFIGGHQ